MSLNRGSKKVAKATSPAQRTPQPAERYLAINKIPASLVRYGIGSYLEDKDTHNLSRSGCNLHSALNKELDKRALEQLLQAMIDDDRQKVTRILQCKPHLLLLEPTELGIKEIESKKTWQRFRTEKVFIMAQKLKRPGMTGVLLPYFNNIQQVQEANEAKDATSEVLKQWIFPVAPENKEQQKKWQEQQEALDKELQRKYINDYFIKLIETLASDDRIEVKWEMNHERKLYEAQVLNPSEATQKALDAFRNMLLPDAAVSIDKYCDIAQLLIAACNAFDEHFSDTDNSNSKIYFRNWHQRYAYAVCVVGFIIPLLGGPEVGKKWCRGFYYDINKIPPPEPNPHAEALQLIDCRSFYRESKSSRAGPGFTFLCDIYGLAVHGLRRWWPFPGAFSLENYVKQTRQSFSNLRGECIGRPSMLRQPNNRGA